MAKIALTIDIEDWYHTPAITGSNFSLYPDVFTFMETWKNKFDFLSNPTTRVLDILDELNLKATFFVVADVIDFYPGLVESIVECGHEIGCHGLHHSVKIHTSTKIPLCTVTEFEDQTGKARELLQKSTGQKIEGYRAPGAYVGKWMFKSLINLGFKYDSSVNPNSFFNKTDFNTKNIRTTPYVIAEQDGNKKLVEFPWCHWRVGSLRFPTAGGPFLRFLPAKYIISGLRDSLKRGETVFYFHPIDITNKKLPGIASSNFKRPLYFVTSGEKTEKKLKIILNAFLQQWTMCENILDLE